MATLLSSFMSRTTTGPGSLALAMIFGAVGSPAPRALGSIAAQAATRQVTESSRPRDMSFPPERAHGTVRYEEYRIERGLRARRLARGPGVSGLELHLAVEAGDQEQSDGGPGPGVGRSWSDLPGNGQDLAFDFQRVEVDSIRLGTRYAAHGQDHLFAPVDRLDFEELGQFGLDLFLDRLVFRGCRLTRMSDQLLGAADHHAAVVLELNGADVGRTRTVLSTGDDFHLGGVFRV